MTYSEAHCNSSSSRTRRIIIITTHVESRHRLVACRHQFELCRARLGFVGCGIEVVADGLLWIGAEVSDPKLSPECGNSGLRSYAATHRYDTLWMDAIPHGIRSTRRCTHSLTDGPEFTLEDAGVRCARQFCPCHSRVDRCFFGAVDISVRPCCCGR